MTEAASVSARLRAALRRLATGDWPGARREATEIVAHSGDPAEVAGSHLILTRCFEHDRDLAGAVLHARAALSLAPTDPKVLYRTAEVLEASGEKHEAIANLRLATSIHPQFAQAYHLLGILLGEAGDSNGALTAFEATVRIDPAHFRGWNNMGNVQRSLGQSSAAEVSFARALDLRPDYALAAANLASMQRDRGDVVAAEATARGTLSRVAKDPKRRPLLVLLAGLLRERSELDEAAQLYLEAIRLAPAESGNEWFHLGWTLSERGDVGQAREAFGRAHAASRIELRGAIGHRLVLPMVHANVSALDHARVLYASGIGELNAQVGQLVSGLDEPTVLDGLRWTNFLLAYQGRDDRLLQEGFAKFMGDAIEAVAPRWRAPIEPRPVVDRRIRIGFASALLRGGTCGLYFQSWITDLDPDRFDVFIYQLRPADDPVWAAIEKRAQCVRSFAGSRARPSIVAPVIVADDLDVLVYPELGMDGTAFCLSALRLAPRQYVGWGHPVTTGHSTLDGYFTSEPMEPAGCTAHYSEPLIMLPGLGTRYRHPVIPGDGDRAQFGLPESVPLALCPQSMFKIHPDNDRLFARVLAASPGSRLVLFSARHPAVTDRYMRRLAGELAGFGIDVRARVIVLPLMNHDDYLRVNRLCDFALDTLYWSGGNTSLDALAAGLPIVTHPGEFMRGRQSAAMLRLMHVDELIARDLDDYVSTASRLAGDPAWRIGLARRIAEGRFNVFDDPTPPAAFAAAIEQRVRSVSSAHRPP